MKMLNKNKELLLIRHAKSSWKHPELSDFDRPLNNRGKRDAPFMGKKLAEKKVSPNLIISSPAKRARTTAEVIADEVGFPKKEIVFEKKIYEASVSDLLKIIDKLDESQNIVMLFGHNPGLTQFNNFLTNHFIDNIPTCGIVSIIFDCKWCEISEAAGKFNSFFYPKLFI